MYEEIEVYDTDEWQSRGITATNVEVVDSR